VLRMLHGVAPSEAQAKTLDTYFAAMAESGMGPATFTARTVASTRASLAAAVLAAWCSFTGPLHGGAPGPTLDMLDAAAAAEAADDLDAWIERKLTSGERLAGFGHRVFRGNDPRAAALRAALQKMAPGASRLDFVAHLEQRVAAVVARVKPGRHLPANVEVMAALLLDAVGIPRQAFTAIFAITRSAGWIAHALEQLKTGRMIRPASEYVGPPIE
jgi:citrate synthase